MQNRAIAGRLYKSFMIVTFIMGAAALLLFFGIRRYTGNVRQLDELRDGARVGTIHFKTQVQEWKNILIRGQDESKLREYRMRFESEAKLVDSELDAIEHAASPEIVQIAHGLRQKLVDLDSAYLKALADYDSSDRGSTQKIDNRVKGIDRGATEDFDALAKAIDEYRISQSKQEEFLLQVVMLTIGCLALGFSWFILFGTVRQVRAAIGTTVQGIEKANNESNLTVRLAPNAREFSPLVDGFNHLIERIQVIVSKLSRDATDLSDTASELNRAAEELSDSAQNQASATEEMAASVEEVSGGADSIAQNAKAQAQHLGRLAEQSAQNAAEGTTIRHAVQSLAERTQETARDTQQAESSLGDMNKAMEQIAASASMILEIVSALGEISDQVDLLALNAAIEAARAGEAGRGFAVVAQSIGELAGKTQQRLATINEHARANANEVTRGIERVSALTSVTKRILDRVGEMTRELANIGSRITRQADSTTVMDRSTREVNQLASEISIAAGEQLAALNELGRTTGSLAHQTQEQATAAEQVASAVMRLKNFAAEMQKSASEFQT
ncbi:MAG: methyl-accepting chemotaxis protein [Spirochaetia bacterium]|nr:methyl-accepting chemotaxis protein [Spirochaetia bacterium]